MNDVSRLRDFQLISVEFNQEVDVALRSPLIERIQRIRGVVTAIFDSSNSRVLTVKFGTGSLSASTLLSFLEQKGFAASAVIL